MLLNTIPTPIIISILIVIDIIFSNWKQTKRM